MPIHCILVEVEIVVFSTSECQRSEEFTFSVQLDRVEEIGGGCMSFSAGPGMLFLGCALGSERFIISTCTTTLLTYHDKLYSTVGSW